jgi:hypothetical protein
MMGKVASAAVLAKSNAGNKLSEKNQRYLLI